MNEVSHKVKPNLHSCCVNNVCGFYCLNINTVSEWNSPI